MNQCDICGAEWDPRSQAHRAGQDCARGLKEQLDGLSKTLKKVENIIQEWIRGEKAKDDSTIDGFKRIGDGLAELTKRHEALAKRVHLVEHPDLRKVRSMPKTNEG